MSGTLVSPGVDVTITNDPNYASAPTGAIPLVVFATSANKPTPSGTGIAPFTAPGTAGQLFLATSQREALANFGVPNFTTVQGTPVQGDELNEYGLWAAYSYLGISSNCYMLRADIDLAQLAPSASAPVGAPTNGTYWFDLTSTAWGLFRSNGSALAGNAWVSQTVLVVPYNAIDNTYAPVASYGANGQYAIVPWTVDNLVYEKINGAWYQVGTSSWEAQHPTVVTGIANPGAVSTTDSFTINGITVSLASSGGTASGVATAIATAMTGAGNTTISATVVNNALQVTNSAGTGLTFVEIGASTALTVLGLTSLKGIGIYWTSDASWPSGSASGDLWIKGTSSNMGAKWVVKYYNSATAQWSVVTAPHFQFNSAVPDGTSGKDAAAITALGTPTTGTVYVGYDPNTGVQQIRIFTNSAWATMPENLTSTWESLQYEADFTAPTTSPTAGTYWYNPVPAIDVMVGDGMSWHGYRRVYAETDASGVILSGSAPTQQVTGHSVVSGGSTTTSYTLVDNDLWLDTSDLENYPKLYQWNTTTQSWNLINNTDHTSPFGIVFADARQDSGVSFTGIQNAGAYAYNSTSSLDMTLSDYVDPDAPLADAYPTGMLLFNTRFSTGNVKTWQPNYFKVGGYSATDYTVNTYQNGNPAVTFPATTGGRWVSASGLNATTLAPYMMRKAQRIMVVNALAAAITTNQDIRSELVYYNILACPGYVELLPDMHSLNVDQKEVSFIVADTPIRLPSDGTSIQNWAMNAKNVAADGEDGLVTAYKYAGLFYPWGLGTDTNGNEVMVPPSALALNVFAYNDQVAYPWFAPAGFQRGLVNNASSVGYLANNGTYQPIILNPGQRDVLYGHHINPIAYIPGRGLVIYGQKTSDPNAGALDRINVARLANYIAYNLDNIVKPYLFEQNDATTRKLAKNTVERFLNSLVGLRALADYAVVCDATNNTPDVVNQNQLWIDVLIQPIKAIEFIYVPVRIENTSVNATASTISKL